MYSEILYRDSDAIVCVKPAGIPSESHGLPELIAAQEAIPLPFPVHRLDKPAGGAIILAVDSRACASLQQAFVSGLVIKEYLAAVSGTLPDSSGTFTDLLYHDSARNKTYVVDRARKGVKKAVCGWKVLQTVYAQNEPVSLLQIRLQTGRTHQIRVQFASRKMPLIGDRRYGSPIHLDGDRIALWSFHLQFPASSDERKTVSVYSRPPAVFPWNCFTAGVTDSHAPAALSSGLLLP